jgi:hypothetical protein
MMTKKKPAKKPAARKRPQTLKATPAMAAGLTDHAWDVREILALM